MNSMTKAVCVLALGIGFGCGYGKKEVQPPVATPVNEVVQKETRDDELLDSVKFDEINYTMNKKAKTLSACHYKGVEAGELKDNEKVKITLGMTIEKNGSLSDVRVLERSKKSDALEACAIETASDWEFTTLPTPFETSRSFTLLSY